MVYTVDNSDESWMVSFGKGNAGRLGNTWMNNIVRRCAKEETIRTNGLQIRFSREKFEPRI